MFRSRSFFLSLLLGNLLLAGVILGVGFLTIHYDVNRRSSRLAERFQEQLLLIVRNDLQETWPDVGEKMDMYCGVDFKEVEFRLTIVDTAGRVLGESDYSSEKMETHTPLDRPEIAAALNGERGEDVRTSKTTHIKYKYLAYPILQNGKPVAVVRIAIPLANIVESRQMLFCGMFVSFALLLLLATLLSLLLSWIWYKPLRILNNEARRIAEGDMEPSAGMESPLEMAQLSSSLETMRRTVSGQFKTITNQRESLQTILHHLPDAIFAINRSAEVIYFNAAAKKLFRLESPIERPFLQELVRNAAIVEWYLRCRKIFHLADSSAHVHSDPAGLASLAHAGGKIERKEIDLFGHRHHLELEFVITGTETKEEDAASLLIFRDMTEGVRANKMKTDFVANASHELRTPLAAIRAALDNVSDEVYEDRNTLEKIIQIVDRHTSRLGALIEDLLALQGAEDETIPARLEETNVAEQRTWIEELFRKRIDEKNFVFSVMSDFGDASFRIDNKRLGLILQNLIDNALKFTPSGGEISLSFRREETFLVAECSDKGMGIAVEEQQRVFERFYQGNSSRTGDGRLRGTGLGLAIVKHAVERLKGSISLESRLAQGSVFTVRIPVEFM